MSRLAPRELELILFLFVFIVLGLLSQQVLAYDIPVKSLKSALEDSEFVAVGRVVAIKETKRDKFETSALATIEIIECAHGYKCSTGDIAKLSYVLDSVKDNVMPIQLNVGQEYIFALRTKVSNLNNIVYSNDINKGLDQAFELNLEESNDGIQIKFQSRGKIVVTSIYHRKASEFFDSGELRKMVR